MRGDRDAAITMKAVAEYRETAAVGDTVYVPRNSDETCYNKGGYSPVRKGWIRTHIVLKAPYLAMTQKGAFRWEDLYRWRKEYTEKYGD